MPFVKVNKKDFEWEVRGDGRFYVQIPVEGADDIRVNAKSLEELTAELKKLIAAEPKKELGIKLVLKEYDHPAERITIRSMHATQRNTALITHADGHKGSQYIYGRNVWYRDMPDEEIAEINRLQESVATAQEKLNVYLEERVLREGARGVLREAGVY